MPELARDVLVQGVVVGSLLDTRGGHCAHRESAPKDFFVRLERKV